MGLPHILPVSEPTLRRAWTGLREGTLCQGAVVQWLVQCGADKIKTVKFQIPEERNSGAGRGLRDLLGEGDSPGGHSARWQKHLKSV